MGLSLACHAGQHAPHVDRRSGVCLWRHYSAVGHGTQGSMVTGRGEKPPGQCWSVRNEAGVRNLEGRDDGERPRVSAGDVGAMHRFLTPRSMILFAPAIRLSTLVLLAPAHHLYRWAWPQGKRLTLAEDEDYAKYASCPLNAGYQVYTLTQELGAPD